MTGRSDPDSECIFRIHYIASTTVVTVKIIIVTGLNLAAIVLVEEVIMYGTGTISQRDRQICQARHIPSGSPMYVGDLTYLSV
jgi:hypothetical protein